VAVLTGLILVAAGAYTFLGTGVSRPVNGMKIIGAAHAYTRALMQNHQAIPPSVPLQVLVEKGFLQPADIGSFQGMDAAIILTKSGPGPTVLMRVHMPDGDLLLLGDGSAQKVPSSENR
jgi:hypothetical protein